MLAFFHGWRRKLGCATLVIALVLMGGWIRSCMVFDRISFAIGTRQHELTSIGNHVWWCSWEPVSLPTQWSSSTKRLSAQRVTESFVATDREYRIMRDHWGATHRFVIWNTPYWSIVLPLTLLSAYLLLRKPRTKPKQAEASHGQDASR